MLISLYLRTAQCTTHDVAGRSDPLHRARVWSEPAGHLGYRGYQLDRGTLRPSPSIHQKTLPLTLMHISTILTPKSHMVSYHYGTTLRKWTTH